MICHSNTSSAELIEYLRDVAIRANAKPQWIWAIDRLQDADAMECERDQADEELRILKDKFNEARHNAAHDGCSSVSA